MNPKLKPCPCCGGKAEYSYEYPSAQNVGHVECQACLVRTGNTYRDVVVRAWNRRVR